MKKEEKFNPCERTDAEKKLGLSRQEILEFAKRKAKKLNCSMAHVYTQFRDRTGYEQVNLANAYTFYLFVLVLEGIEAGEMDFFDSIERIS